jgi:hypothetical protein
MPAWLTAIQACENCPYSSKKTVFEAVFQLSKLRLIIIADVIATFATPPGLRFRLENQHLMAPAQNARPRAESVSGR